MLTIEQIRAGRALLDWSQSDLADHAGLSQTGIARIENGTNQPNSKTLKKIQTAFDDADIEFLGRTGVRKRSGETKVLRGTAGFKAFLDDVYNTAIKYGTKEEPVKIFLSNVVHDNWVKFMGDYNWAEHTKRMIDAKDVMDVRIIVKEGDWNFPAKEYAQYKWFPEDMFTDQSFYAYHNKLAFLNFKEEDVSVLIINQYEFASGYRTLFRIAWDNLAKKPE